MSRLRSPTPIVKAHWFAFIAVLKKPDDGLTLDLLRSHLSHEASAKFARLAGLLAEWRLARYRPEDAAETEQILRRLETLYVGHARLTAKSLSAFHRLARILLSIIRMREMARSDLSRQDTLDSFDGELRHMERSAQILIERISERYAVRLPALARSAYTDLTRESAALTKAGRLALVDEIDDGAAGGTWIPRVEASRWSDVITNLLRNGVEAAADRSAAKRSEPAATAEPAPLPPPQVTVSLRRGASPGKAVLEIADEGVGMPPVEADSIWTTGRSRHGRGRGHGLTEAKRAFLLSRGDVEVRSATGVGTCVRIDVAPRDVPIAPVRLWEIPPVVVPAVLLVAAAAVGLSTMGGPDPTLVRAAGPTTVAAETELGRMLWQRDLGEAILPNEPTGVVMPPGVYKGVEEHQLLVRNEKGRVEHVLVATQAAAGPARIWFLDRRGRVEEVRPLAWTPPSRGSLSHLTCTWRKQTRWADGQTALVLHVREGNYASTVTQFLSTAGESLGAYYHQGHLLYRADLDLDGDGKTEILLHGINNPAQSDSTIFAADVGQYVHCVVLLEVPRVNGQAYPYRTWQGMPEAREEGYLLIPPLAGVPLVIHHINIGDTGPDGTHQVEVVLYDGRIYRCDEHLRPLTCTTGDLTPARALAPIEPLGPLVYFHDGERVDIRIPIAAGGI